MLRMLLCEVTTLRYVARVGAFPSSAGGASRVRLVRKRAHCAAQSIVEALVAVTILLIVVWALLGFLANGRVLVERTGQCDIAAQVAEQQIDQTRALAYASIAAGNGAETVGGIKYTWVLTVATAKADPADANSTFKQVGVVVTWATGPHTNATISTATAQ